MWRTRADRLLTRSKDENWTEADLAFSVVWFGQRCSGQSEERIGIEVANEALARCQNAESEVLRALIIHRAILQLNYARTCMDSGNLSGSFGADMAAARDFCRIDMLLRASNAFDRAEKVFNIIRPPYDDAVMVSLAVSSPTLESSLQAQLLRLRSMWRQVLGDAIFGPMRFDPVVLAQVAKSASLICWRAGQSKERVLDKPAVRTAYESWKARSVDVFPVEVLRDYEFGSDLEGLLTAYHDDSDQPGSTDIEQVFNLQRQFDRVLATELSKAAPDGSTDPLTLSDIQSVLTSKTVLMSSVTCPTADGRIGSFSLLITRDSCKVVIAMGEKMWWNVQIGKVWTDSVAGAVVDLRRHLRKNEPEINTPSAADLSEFVFGPVREHLSKLHGQGYTHLCINPAGALHYCPLSLLRLTERSIGIDWTVTHLPALAFLVPRDRADGAAPRSGGAALGVTFMGATRDLHGQKSLKSVEPEIVSVAAAMRTQALLDGNATASTLNAALREKRYVHLATHGRQDPSAPSFQVLYLHPDEHHSGVYRAFEVLDHCLDGLELVTLSACETSLGRIDAGDNPRGLQAFLLVAGARAVISCLWPVHDDVSRFFFTDLYRNLISEDLDKLTAFGNALKLTRENFPGPEDWGAFQFSGAW